MLESVIVKSEQELNGNYADLLLIPKEKIEERYGILMEMKYIKQEDYDKDNSLLEKKEKFVAIVIFRTVITCTVNHKATKECKKNHNCTNYDYIFKTFRFVTFHQT